MFEESVTSIPSIWASMNSWFTPTVLFLFLNLMIGTIYVTSNLANATHKPPSSSTIHQNQHYPNHHIVRSPSVLQRIKSINFYNYRSPEPPIVTQEKPHHFETIVNTHFSFQQSPLEEYHQNQPFLSRSPSMLQRIKSINLYNYFSQEVSVNQETETPISQFATLTQDLHQEEEEKYFQENVEKEHEHEHEHLEYIEEDQMSEEGDQEQTLDEVYSKLNSNKEVSRSKSDMKPTSGEVPKKLPKKMKKSASSKSAFAHFKEEDVEARRPATVREGKASSRRLTDIDDDEVDAKADDFINKFKQQLKLQRIDSIIRYKDMVNSGSNGN